MDLHTQYNSLHVFHFLLKVFIHICSYTEFGIELLDVATGNLKISYEHGELKLGKLDKEYFDDPDLHNILQGTELDTSMMERLEKQKLYLIYDVIYSEKFELDGKRQSEVLTKLHNIKFRFSVLPPTNATYNNKRSLSASVSYFN